jgi:hypothetical protein
VACQLQGLLKTHAVFSFLRGKSRTEKCGFFF